EAVVARVLEESSRSDRRDGSLYGVDGVIPTALRLLRDQPRAPSGPPPGSQNIPPYRVRAKARRPDCRERRFSRTLSAYGGSVPLSVAFGEVKQCEGYRLQ